MMTVMVGANQNTNPSLTSTTTTTTAINPSNQWPTGHGGALANFQIQRVQYFTWTDLTEEEWGVQHLYGANTR